MVEKETADGFVLDGEPRDIDLTYRYQDTPVVTFDSEWQNSRQKAKVIVTKKEKDYRDSYQKHVQRGTYS